MITEEQVRILLSMDSKEFNAAISNASEKVEHFGKHGHQWFQHVGSAGRSFHKVVEQITEAFPLLGAAIKFINPITGALSAATAAFVYLNKQLEEWNKEMDEAAEKASKPFGRMKEALHEADEEIRKMERDYDRFQEKLGGHGTAETAAAMTEAADRKRIARIDELKSALERVRKEQEEIDKQSLEQISKGLRPSLKAFGMAALGPSAARDAAQEEYDRKERELIDKKDRSLKEEAAIRKHLIDLQQQQEHAVDDLKNKEDIAEKSRDLEREFWKEWDETGQKLSEKFWDEWDKMGDDIAAREHKRRELNIEAGRARREFNESRISEHLPTLQQLANSGKWLMPGWFEKGQHADQAQEILNLKADQDQAVLEEKGGYRSARFRKDQARIDVLQKELVDAGVARPDSALEALNDKMGRLLEQAQEDGIKIQVPEDGS